jgi:hypothetical protein
MQQNEQQIELKNKTHKLKTWLRYFYAIKNGTKTFELRKNDRDFQVGDTLVLQEYDENENEYTGRELSVVVSYVILEAKHFGLMDGFCIMGFSTPSPEAKDEQQKEESVCPNCGFGWIPDFTKPSEVKPVSTPSPEVKVDEIAENYCGYCRYLKNDAGETYGFEACNQNDEGAFRVYKWIEISSLYQQSQAEIERLKNTPQHKSNCSGEMKMGTAIIEVCEECGGTVAVLDKEQIASLQSQLETKKEMSK